jgi:hypothetical protein
MIKLLILSLGILTQLNVRASLPAALSLTSQQGISPREDAFGPEFRKHPRLRFHEKKGTMGTILPLTLGPLGYLIIRISSHDQVIIEHAKKAISIWIVMAVLGGMLWYGATYNYTVMGKAFDDILAAIAQSFANSN